MKPKTSDGSFAKKRQVEQVPDDNIRFRKLIENSHDGITLLDKDFNIFYRSSSAERIVGWKNAYRIRKKNAMDLIHPDEQQQVKSCLDEIINNPERSQTCIFKSKHSAGHFIWLEGLFTNFLHDPDIRAIVCNFRDISQRKRDEELIQQTLQELLAYKHALDRSLLSRLPIRRGLSNTLTIIFVVYQNTAKAN